MLCCMTHMRNVHIVYQKQSEFSKRLHFLWKVQRTSKKRITTALKEYGLGLRRLLCNLNRAEHIASVWQVTINSTLKLHLCFLFISTYFKAENGPLNIKAIIDSTDGLNWNLGNGHCPIMNTKKTNKTLKAQKMEQWSMRSNCTQCVLLTPSLFPFYKNQK